MRQEFVFEADGVQSGRRVDAFCSEKLGKTRSSLLPLFDEGLVLLNGAAAKAGARLSDGDVVSVSVPAPRAVDLLPQNIPLDIVYEDGDIIVINKPRGMVVHPAAGNPDGTLVNALMYHVTDLSGIGGELRPGIVHRIDKMTSGLIAVAKNDAAHVSLAAQIKEHTAKRTYIAIVDGNIREETGTVNAPIGRHPHDRKRMAVTANGRAAVTHFTVLDRYGDYTLICAMLETGRTHQIRVHMASVNHPVAGDAVYGRGKQKLGLEGQALHAIRLELTHPRDGRRMTFVCGVPSYFRAALNRLGCEFSDERLTTLVERAVNYERERE